MKHRPPPPPSLETREGLSYAVFAPEGEPDAGVVIVHGAGSAKESHFDFARAARARGMVALCFDARGHGHSSGAFGASAVDDVLAMCALVRERAPRVALRGSSLGGMLAIHAAADAAGDVGAVVAICPAPESLLLRQLRRGEVEGFRADVEPLTNLLERLDLARSAASLAPRTALLLLHARGDERVPYTVSEELYAAAGEPKRLLLLPGGHHRSIQHDMELQGESLRFIERSLSGV